MFKVLQMGRGLGALAVALFHLSLAFNDSRFGMSEDFLRWMRLGQHRVEFFFALSGFIILYAHWKDVDQPAVLGKFYVKRTLRLYPLFWIAVAFVGLKDLVSHNASVPPMGQLFSNLTLIKWVPGIPSIMPVWTLFHEIFFCGVFSLLILRRKIGVVALWAWVLAIIFLSSEFPENIHAGFFDVMVNPINLCFVGGMGAFFIYRHVPAEHSPWLIASGLCVLAVALTGTTQHDDILAFYSLMSLGIGLLLGGAIGLERLGKVRNIPPLVFLGNASYSIYLFHVPMLLGILKFADRYKIKTFLGIPFLFVLTFCLVIVLCVLVHFYIEKPLNRLISKFVGTGKKPEPQRVAELGAAR